MNGQLLCNYLCLYVDLPNGIQLKAFYTPHFDWTAVICCNIFFKMLFCFFVFFFVGVCSLQCSSGNAGTFATFVSIFFILPSVRTWKSKTLMTGRKRKVSCRIFKVILFFCGIVRYDRKCIMLISICAMHPLQQQNVCNIFFNNIFLSFFVVFWTERNWSVLWIFEVVCNAWWMRKKKESAHVVIITHLAVFYLRNFYVSISFSCVCFNSTNCFDLYCEQLLKSWNNEKQGGVFERKILASLLPDKGMIKEVLLRGNEMSWMGFILQTSPKLLFCWQWKLTSSFHLHCLKILRERKTMLHSQRVLPHAGAIVAPWV